MSAASGLGSGLLGSTYGVVVGNQGLDAGHRVKATACRPVVGQTPGILRLPPTSCGRGQPGWALLLRGRGSSRLWPGRGHERSL